jgi:hypothetical protein
VLELADPLGLPVVTHAERPSVAIRIPLPAPDGADEARLDARVGPLGASVEAFHPELGSLRASEGEVRVTHLERTLGGRVEGRFSVRCPSRVGRVEVRGRFRTFVRDVAGPADAPLDDLDGVADGQGGPPRRR